MLDYDMFIQTLGRRNTPLAEVLAASPFDSNHNFGGQLTENLFFDNLFICTEHFLALQRMLLEYLDSPIQHSRVISCTGFSGIGKTTFLRYFQRTATQFEHIHLDCYTLNRHGQTARSPLGRTLGALSTRVNEIHESPSFSRLPADLQVLVVAAKQHLESAGHDKNPILGILKNYLTTIGDDDFSAVFHLILEHELVLGTYFSRHFCQCLTAAAPGTLAQARLDLLNSANVSDIFSLFFLHIFRNYDQSKPFLIYFDNLDAVEIDYLSQYFQDIFLRCLIDATDLGQERIFSPKIDVVNQYRFIFCLRDGTAGAFNTHLLDNVGHTVTTIAFRLRADGTAYETILEKRLDLWAATAKYRTQKAGTTSDPSPNRVIAAMRALKNDKYFRLVLAPLFNGDLRRITKMIFAVAEELVQSGWEACPLVSPISKLRKLWSSMVCAARSYSVSSSISVRKNGQFRIPFLSLPLSGTAASASPVA